MRKNFGVKTWLCPQPVMIIATYNEDGTANAMNAAWGGIAGDNKIIVDLGKHKTTDNISKTNAFTVAFADLPHVTACDYLGIVSGCEEPGKLDKSGFTVEKSEFVNAPVINELPVSLECELLDIIDGSLYLGRIVNVSCDEKFLGSDGNPDFSKFTPVTFNPVNNTYVSLGECVGRAFEDGNSLR